jgi:hypothetical protein
MVCLLTIRFGAASAIGFAIVKPIAGEGEHVYPGR